MCRLARSVLPTIALVVAASGVSAQTVRVQRNVNLRRTPSTQLPPIRKLLPPQELELLDTVRTDDYYHVVFVEASDTGWVWANNVQLMSDSGAVVGTGNGTIAGAIDPDWAKPQPVAGDFTSPVRDSVCGPVGSVRGDTSTNRRKNRTDVPAAYHPVSFDAIADLPFPATRATFRNRWPADSVAVLSRVEGVAVQVVGYLAAIKPQTGNKESTNCYMTRASETDWHVALVKSFGQGEADAVVVEPTPRIRIEHPKWTVTRLRPWLDAPNPVRISGWLMFDPAHRNHIGRYRKTLWEIHPVTQIEVWSDGAWVTLDSLP